MSLRRLRHWCLAVALAPLTLASAAELTVGPGTETFRTLTEALAAATEGDRVVAHAGVYAEDLKLRSGVTVEAEGEVRIKPPKTILLTGLKDVVLRGFVLIAPGEGATPEAPAPTAPAAVMPVVSVGFGQNISIVSCRFECDMGRAIDIGLTRDAVVENCTFTGTDPHSTGITLQGSSARISGCVFTGLGTAVAAYNTELSVGKNLFDANAVAISATTSKLKATGNTITGPGDGVISATSAFEIVGNAIRKCRRSILAAGGSGTIRANTVSQNFVGIWTTSVPVRIFDNTVLFNSTQGIALTKPAPDAPVAGAPGTSAVPDGAEVFQNAISNNATMGILISDYPRARVVHNVIDANGAGAVVEASVAELSQNTIVLNVNEGVVIDRGAKARTERNQIAFNRIGIQRDITAELASDRNNVFGNLLTRGFPLLSGDYTRIDRLVTGSGERIHVVVAPDDKGKGATDFSVDPGFVKLGTDYHLRRDSPVLPLAGAEIIGALPPASP